MRATIEARKHRLPEIEDMENLRAISILDDGETWGGTGIVCFLTEAQLEVICEGELADIESESTVVSISIDRLLRSHFELLDIQSNLKLV